MLTSCTTMTMATGYDIEFQYVSFRIRCASQDKRPKNDAVDIRQVSEAVEEYANSASMHGIGHFSRAGVPIQNRLFWITVFVCCVTVLGYQISALISRYHEFEKQTNIEVLIIDQIRMSRKRSDEIRYPSFPGCDRLFAQSLQEPRNIKSPRADGTGLQYTDI